MARMDLLGKVDFNKSVWIVALAYSIFHSSNWKV